MYCCFEAVEQVTLAPVSLLGMDFTILLFESIFYLHILHFVAGAVRFELTNEHNVFLSGSKPDALPLGYTPMFCPAALQAAIANR